jgi:5-methyltetrahydropteroyltriglutamate--homocysteine methyltransferase
MATGHGLTQTGRAKIMTLNNIRTDVVGSLLRPDYLKDGRKELDAGELSQSGFKKIEDRAVTDAVALQESAGLEVLTDGEMRRLNFQESFGAAVEGFDAGASTVHTYERRVEGSAPGQRWEIPELGSAGTAVSHRRPVISRLKLVRNIPLDEYEAVAKVAKIPAKVTLIGPDRISQRFAYEKSATIYDGMDDFLADVVEIERTIVKGLADAGCKYVQIDAPGFTAYVDEPSLAQMRDRGEDPMQNFVRSLKAEADVIKDFPGVTFGIHLCRGNQRSMWHREGTYDAIAERLFNELPHDRFLLEYDTPRAGSFAPLRFVPKGKTIVLGLITTKTPTLETVDELRARIDEAAEYIPLDQLALSPQCGFASDVIGNLVSQDDQKRKFEVMVETARKVWPN